MENEQELKKDVKPENPEKRIEEKKERVKSWLKNPENLILLGILIFAFFIRLYYFNLTKQQPLWWDEAEYGLKAKSLAFNTPTTGWFGAREIVVPFLFSLILRIGGTEVSLRIVQLLVSFAAVFMVYLLGKEMFNKKIALITSAIMAVNAVHLFFTGRILTYIWAPLFFIFTFYLFYMGYVKRKGKKYLYSLPVVAALGLSTYGSLAFGLGAIVLFLIVTERHRFLLKKEIWLILLIGFLSLIPQFIYSKITYGSFVARLAGLYSAGHPSLDFSFILSYFKLMPHLFGWIFTLSIVAGAIYIILLSALSFDLILKNENNLLKSYLLLILWVLAVLAFYTYVAVQWGVVYDAFVMPIIPALAVTGAVGINLISELKFNKKFLNLVIITIILFGAYYQVNYANSMIKGKLASFDSIKSAGEWIKQNSAPGDIIISASLPQMTYYSERETYAYTRTPAIKDDPVERTNESEVDKFIKETKPKFITDSRWEFVPPWVHEYITKHNSTFIPVQGFMNPEKTQHTTIVYAYKG